ncbi:MAG: 50S ribosomal protein L23 [Candidatus Saccharimonadales bacterium]
MDMSLVLIPRISEKAYGLNASHNVYVFEVPKNTNKVNIANAISAQFKVTVEEVNIMNVKGKTKRTVRKGGRQTIGQRSSIKKAYVRLKAGDSIAVFPNEEEPNTSKKGTK